ncbi:MAG: glycosyltransferase family 4 protein [Chloroflexota bacterium]
MTETTHGTRNTPLRILLIHQAFAALDEPGGTRHHEFARLLASRGHKITIIASPVSYLTGGKSSQLPLTNYPGKNITILRAYTYQALHKSFVHRVFAFFSFMASSFFVGLGVRGVDVVWGTSPPIFQGVTAWLLARLKGAKFLFEVRDLWPQFAMAVGVLTNPALIKMSLWLERFLYRRADRVMVNSPGYLDHVKGRGARSVELIPNGADPAMFDPADQGESFRTRHLLADKFVVLYAGAHGMSNDLGVVLDAAKLLEGTQIQIVLLGDGKEKAALQARSDALGLDNVTFLPPVPKSGMGAALAGADACLAILKPLDEYKLTYPNKVFDYMAAGRPVVLAIDGVIRQVVEAADCGIFAEPGDPSALAEGIRRLAADRAKSRQMGLNGRAYIESHFSRAAIGEKLVALLQDVVSQP